MVIYWSNGNEWNAPRLETRILQIHGENEQKIQLTDLIAALAHQNIVSMIFDMFLKQTLCMA